VRRINAKALRKGSGFTTEGAESTEWRLDVLILLRALRVQRLLSAISARTSAFSAFIRSSAF